MRTIRETLVFVAMRMMVVMAAIVIATSPTWAATSTDPNFKVAFIGDSGAGSGFQSVLNLIKAEGAQLVLHQGDFAYGAPQPWMDKINNPTTGLGPDFPYLGSDGNHDSFSQYAPFFQEKLSRMGITGVTVPASGDYAVTYKGLKMVFVKEGGNAPFINSQLQADDHVWKVCSWHKNQSTMQLGGKGNEQDVGSYEACRQFGAILATAHEHTYERTKTLTSIPNLTLDLAQHPLQTFNGIPNVPSNPNSVLVVPGKSFVFVSGLGGASIRNQDRCLPSTYPYGGGTGCNYIWASAYTSDQGAKYGALFITFNVDGNPNKARGYFKDVSGQTIDQFEILASSQPGPTNTPGPSPTGGVSPTPTRTLTPTRTPTPGGPSPTRTPTPGPCSSTLANQGDANCDCTVSGVDYAIWLSHYRQSTGNGFRDGDFNGDGTVTGVDYAIWLVNYRRTCSGPTPTPPTGGATNTPTPGGPTPTPQTGELPISMCDRSNAAQNPSYFSPTITNQFFPLPVGMVHTLEGGGIRSRYTVFNQTQDIGGVLTRVAEHREWLNGVLFEYTRDYFVQIPDGTVCYYGEDVFDGSGNPIGGAWRAYVGQNKPGIFMPGQPVVGQTFYQEYAPGVALDRAQIASLGLTLTTPAGTFNNVLRWQETPPGIKHFAPGIGLIADDAERLTCYTNCP